VHFKIIRCLKAKVQFPVCASVMPWRCTKWHTHSAPRYYMQIAGQYISHHYHVLKYAVKSFHYSCWAPQLTVWPVSWRYLACNSAWYQTSLRLMWFSSFPTMDKYNGLCMYMKMVKALEQSLV
jgi:hypothetical protein